MPGRLRFEVAYDGGPFDGWQSQTSGNAVQDFLERAFHAVTGEKVRVHGSGRTDAGVHALAQTAHAHVSHRSLGEEEWVSALNASLPATIRVLRCRKVNDAFHARHSAKGKIYRYRIWNARILPPLEHGRAWQVAKAIEIDAMIEEAKAFVGQHDFAGFAANRGTPPADTMRTIESVRLKRVGACLTIEFAGSGFLYKMVRLMVGALVECGRGKTPVGLVRKELELPNQSSARTRLVAPAAGLYLVRVRY